MEGEDLTMRRPEEKDSACENRQRDCELEKDSRIRRDLRADCEGVAVLEVATAVEFDDSVEKCSKGYQAKLANRELQREDDKSTYSSSIPRTDFSPNRSTPLEHLYSLLFESPRIVPHLLVQPT